MLLYIWLIREVWRGKIGLRPMIMKVAKEFEAEYPFGLS
jgi:hypothetical protein